MESCMGVGLLCLCRVGATDRDSLTKSRVAIAGINEPSSSSESDPASCRRNN